MKRMSWLTICLVGLLMVGCGGGGGGGNASADALQAIVQLENEYGGGSVSDEQYLTRLLGVLQRIDARSNGPEELAQYLESQVLGSGSGLALAAVRTAGGGAAPSDNVQDPIVAAALAETLNQLVTDVMNTEAYQTIEAFLSGVIGALAYWPTSILQVAQPEVFVAAAQAWVRPRAYNDVFGNLSSLGTEQGYQVLNTATQNPFAAEKQRLESQSAPVPAGVTKASEITIQQLPELPEEEPEEEAPSLAGTINGTWSGQCEQHWEGQGNMPVSGTFTMTIHADGSVTGSFSGSDAGSISGSISSSGDVDASTSGSAGQYSWSGTFWRASDGSLKGSGGWDGTSPYGDQCWGSWGNA